MRCEAVLRAMGQRISRTQNARGIPEKFCAVWEADWQALIDQCKSGELGIEAGCEALSLHAQKMTIAEIIWDVVGAEK